MQQGEAQTGLAPEGCPAPLVDPFVQLPPYCADVVTLQKLVDQGERLQAQVSLLASQRPVTALQLTVRMVACSYVCGVEGRTATHPLL